jgi:hypothetical protein
MEARQNRRLYGKMECLPPWAHLNRWEREDFEYCVGEFVCDKVSFFCDFFGKKTLGKYVFGYKKIVVNEQICFCHFCEMDPKKRYLSAVFECKWENRGSKVLMNSRPGPIIY